MQKKLIINLSKPVVELPDVKREYTFKAIKISDNSLKTVLSKIDLKAIKRTVPSFKMKNYTNENKNKFFQISDLSLILKGNI